MAVPSVFISSVVRDFESVREAAAAAVDRMSMYAIRSERQPGAADSPRRALLDEVGDADIYLLLLGERYGDAEPSPTEEEFNEAVRLHRPIIVLKQTVEMEPLQRAFLERVTAGGWADGALYGEFTGADDVGNAVTAALARYQAGIVEDSPAAQARVRQLLERPRSGIGSGLDVRVAFAPLRQTTILDPVTLEDNQLADRLANALREAGAVPQSVGLVPKVSAGGIELDGNEAIEWVMPSARVLADGCIVITAPVAVQEQMGFSSIDPGRLEQAMKQGGRFAQLAWDLIDTRREVGQVAAAASVSGQAGFGVPSGNTVVSGAFGGQVPETVIAPDPPRICPRAQLHEDELARQTVAGVRRIFADGGAVQP